MKAYLTQDSYGLQQLSYTPPVRKMAGEWEYSPNAKRIPVNGRLSAPIKAKLSFENGIMEVDVVIKVLKQKND